MKKIAGKFTSLIVVGIIFVVWNILVWTLSDLKEANVFFYCGYGFTVLAFLIVAGVPFLFRMSKNGTFNVVFPAYIVTGIYFCIAFILNMIYMIISVKTNAKAVVIPNVIILLLYVALMFILYFAFSHIVGHNKVIDEKVYTLKRTVVEIGQIAAIAQDPEVKKQLLELKEMADYSDPLGVSGTASLENEFSNKIAEIRMLVEGAYEKDLIVNKIKMAQNKLRERNELLRAMK